MAPLGAAVEDYCQPLAYYVSCYFKCYKHNRVYLNKLSGSQLKIQGPHVMIGRLAFYRILGRTQDPKRQFLNER